MAFRKRKIAAKTPAELDAMEAAGRIVGIDHYGASAGYQVLYEKFGFTAEAVVAAAKARL